ncbi:MAG: hypothetical protein K0U56_05700 [Actinomycetia bacterium]|nr:hypothetical protein [Actinomycetes bacterium]
MTAIPCSQINSARPLAGTAPTADSWLILYHPGAWGERPIDTLVDEELTSWASHNNATILMARSPQSIAQYPFHTYWFSTKGGGLLRGMLTQDGVPDLSTADPATSLFLVCTNGKRDQCCATLGRRLITQCEQDLAPEIFATVLECSHLGGHRFAPTAMCIPANLVLGRLDSTVVNRFLTTGVIDAQFVRGSTYLDPVEQVIEVGKWPAQVEFHSRVTHGVSSEVSFTCEGITETLTVTDSLVETIASCGSEPKTVHEFHLSERT